MTIATHTHANVYIVSEAPPNPAAVYVDTVTNFFNRLKNTWYTVEVESIIGIPEGGTALSVCLEGVLTVFHGSQEESGFISFYLRPWESSATGPVGAQRMAFCAETVPNRVQTSGVSKWVACKKNALNRWAFQFAYQLPSGQGFEYPAFCAYRADLKIGAWAI